MHNHHEWHQSVNAEFLLPKLVFVTSGSHNGNIVAWANGYGYTGSNGLEAGDWVCQHFADNAPATLGRVWKAWLSTSVVSAESRLTHWSGSYVNVNGHKIANNWDDLVDGYIIRPINTTENPELDIQLAELTQTGTRGTGGNIYGVQICNDWTTDSSEIHTIVGSQQNVDTIFGHWTYIVQAWEDQPPCSSNLHVYCFEQ